MKECLVWLWYSNTWVKSSCLSAAMAVSLEGVVDMLRKGTIFEAMAVEEEGSRKDGRGNR